LNRLFSFFCSHFFDTVLLMPTQPPIVSTPTTFTLPTHKEITLSNGITLIAVEDTAQSLLTMSVVSRRGAAEETTWGETNFMASLLNKGTATPASSGIQAKNVPSARGRSAQEIAEIIDTTGGSLSASCVFDSSAAHLSILGDFTDVGLDLLADIVLHPTFPPDEIERMREQTNVEIEQANNDAGYMSSIALTQGLFRGTPYGHPVFGTLETLPTLQQTHCHAAYTRTFTPEQVFIAAAGNFSLPVLTDALNKRFGAWKPAKETSSDDPAPRITATLADSTAAPKVMLIEKPDAVQTSLRVGFPSANRQDDDFIALQMLNNIFGGSFISRLNHTLREEKGYTYGIQSSVDARKYASVLTIGSHVGSEVVDSAVSEILREMERLRLEPITDDELETTRKYMIGSFALRTETPTQVVSLLSSLELYNLPKDYHAQYLAKIARITKDELFAVQQRRFTTNGLVIAAAGDVEFLRAKLQQFGTVSVVTANGAIAA
jgi:zinc protease